MVNEVRASHILVSSEEEARTLLNQINSGASFAKLAQKHSQCPSGKKGGDLGFFGRGRMVPEFDKEVFSNPKGKVVGPVKSQFGYHLLVVTDTK